MKVVILDYEAGEVKIISADKTDEDNIEEILTERYEYNLSSIEWMAVDELKLKIE